MTGDRSLKISSEGESSKGAKRQNEEIHASTGFGSGPAGRDHLRLFGKNIPIDQGQQQQQEEGPSRLSGKREEKTLKRGPSVEKLTEALIKKDPRYKAIIDNMVRKLAMESQNQE